MSLTPTFSGLTRFIPNYSSMTAPLSQLLPKKTPFYWTSEHSTAFQNIKQAILDKTLTVFDPKADLTVITEASPYGLGTVLIQ